MLHPKVPGPPSSAPRIGLIAGWGRYPVVVATELARQGYATFCMGVKGHADAELARCCAAFDEFAVSRLGRAVRFFRRHGVRCVTLAGKIHKVLLLQQASWLGLWPDWRTFRRFFPHFVVPRKDRKDDTLLMAVVEEFARAGLEIVPATDFAPELLVKHRQLTRRGPTLAERKDIEFGWALAKEMGRLDVGQSIAVRGRAALAVEAIEGTDACIARAGTLCGRQAFTVVKVAKPRQDMRFDVPTIGRRTIETMLAAGATCLAVEAGRTILLDQEEVVRFADDHRVAIVALTADGRLPEGASHPGASEPLASEAAVTNAHTPETLGQARER